MKIGILTQPLHNNYGGILQNYALQVVLKKLGHTPVTIDIQYSPKNIPLTTRIIKFFWRLIKKLRGDKKVIFCDLKRQWEFLNTPGKEQTRFIEANINHEVHTSYLTNDYCKGNTFDAFLVGSDQVWRPRFSPFIKNYFLDFAKGIKTKKISYAASFGTDCWEGTMAETLQIAELAKDFDAISVREKSGIDICKKHFGTSATWVLDPTLLLKKEDYQESLKIEQKNDKSLAVYVLDITPEIEALITKTSVAKGLKVNIIGRPTQEGFPSIESWLRGIFNSEFVLTDSFHGTVFSILAHKQFATIVNKGRGASRFESLLGALGLSNRLISPSYEVSNAEIDYEKVEKKLSSLREISVDFIKNALNG